MNIYKCKIKKIVHETYYEYMAAPNITLARDKAWLENAKEIDCEFLTEPFKDWSTTTISKVSKVEKYEDLPANWLNACPWFHPHHEAIDRDAEMKDYFKVENLWNEKVFAIERDIKDLKYDIQCRKHRIEELEEDLKTIKKAKTKN